MSKTLQHRHTTYSESKNFFYKTFQSITLNARNKFFNLFINNINYSIEKSIIDVGTTPSLDKDQNVFLEKIKDNQNVTCLSNQDCNILKKKYNNIKEVIVGNGLATKLKDNSFDIVHSNATIEHVGSFENQVLFVKEMIRISKKSVFIQTPNRFYPLNFIQFYHLFIGYQKIHRKILKYLY